VSYEHNNNNQYFEARMSLINVSIVPIVERPELIVEAAQHLWDEWPEINAIYGINSPQDYVDSLKEEGKKYQKKESFAITFLALVEYGPVY
jgi:hypothetical protein